MYSKRSNNQINLELTYYDLEQLLSPKAIKSITHYQLNLLKYFIENPNTILQDIKKKQNLKKEQIDNRYKSLKILLTKKLITESNDIIKKRKSTRLAILVFSIYCLKDKHSVRKLKKSY